MYSLLALYLNYMITSPAWGICVELNPTILSWTGTQPDALGSTWHQIIRQIASSTVVHSSATLSGGTSVGAPLTELHRCHIPSWNQGHGNQAAGTARAPRHATRADTRPVPSTCLVFTHAPQQHGRRLKLCGFADHATVNSTFTTWI